MKIKEIISEAKPSEISTFKNRGYNAFGISGIRVYYNKNNISINVGFDYEPELPLFIQEKDAIDTVFDRYQKDFPSLKIEDLKVSPITSDDNIPSLDKTDANNPKLNPNQVDTPIQRIQQYTRKSDGKIFDNEQTTVANIRNIIDDSIQDEKRKPYYTNFLNYLINRTGLGFKPFVLVDNVQDYENAGFEVGAFDKENRFKDLVTDFGEIASPVGLICKSINGNATRMISQILGENDIEKLKENATIHFHPSQTHELVDSYIEYNGNVLRISTKAGKDLSNGSGASLMGVYKSLEEINANPEASRMLQELLRNKDYREAFRWLEILAKVIEPEIESEESVSGNTRANKVLESIMNQIDLLNSINGQELITDSDKEIIRKIWGPNGSNKMMNSKKSHFGAALDSVSDIHSLDPSIVNGIGKFSDNFKKFVKTSILTRPFNQPSISSGSDTYKKMESNKGWWLKIKKALIYHIATGLNKKEQFSKLCTWILNHGSFCQVDIIFDPAGNKELNTVVKERRTPKELDKQKLVVTNIVATWPSTVINEVYLLPEVLNDGFKYKLTLNRNEPPSDDQLRDLVSKLKSDNNDILKDQLFGFDLNEYSDIIMPNKEDLALSFNDWINQAVTHAKKSWDDENGTELTQYKKRQREAEKSQGFNLLKNTISELVEIGVPTKYEPKNTDDLNTLVDKMSNSIVSILSGNAIDKFVILKNIASIAKRNLWLLNDTDTINENENIAETNNIVNNLINQLYYSVLLIDAVKNDKPTEKIKDKLMIYSGNNQRLVQVINSLNKNSLSSMDNMSIDNLSDEQKLIAYYSKVDGIDYNAIFKISKDKSSPYDNIKGGIKLKQFLNNYGEPDERGALNYVRKILSGNNLLKLEWYRLSNPLERKEMVDIMVNDLTTKNADLNDFVFRIRKFPSYNVNNVMDPNDSSISDSNAKIMEFVKKHFTSHNDSLNRTQLHNIVLSILGYNMGFNALEKDKLEQLVKDFISLIKDSNIKKIIGDETFRKFHDSLKEELDKDDIIEYISIIYWAIKLKHFHDIGLETLFNEAKQNLLSFYASNKTYSGHIERLKFGTHVRTRVADKSIRSNELDSLTQEKIKELEQKWNNLPSVTLGAGGGRGQENLNNAVTKGNVDIPQLKIKFLKKKHPLSRELYKIIDDNKRNEMVDTLILLVKRNKHLTWNDLINNVKKSEDYVDYNTLPDSTKIPTSDIGTTPTPDTQPVVKRPRGRPRKNPPTDLPDSIKNSVPESRSAVLKGILSVL
jgi:hypothetical protein